MPERDLHQEEQAISKLLKRNAIIAAIMATTGFSLLVPAFSTQGTRFDYQEFCYQPRANQQRGIDGCLPEETRRGIAWKLALEVANNSEFRDNTTFSNFVPAQNPYAGLFGLCGAAFFGSAFFFLRHGTNRLEENLDLVVSNKTAVIQERSLAQDKHLNLYILQTKQEEEFITEIMNREHSAAMYELLGEGEKELAARSHHNGEQLSEAQLNLQLATFQAQTAEQLEKEAKHRAELEKLKRPAKKRDSGTEATGNEAAKAELIDKLKSHEDGWLYELCTGYKPLWILGDMGSWKTYCAGAIALARYHLEGWKLESICDPHLHQNRSKGWKELLTLEPECYGNGQDWESVNTALLAAFDRWATREEDKDPIITSIWDEMTNYAKHEECAKAASEFAGRAVSDPRKASEGIILIAHAFTNATTGGSEGYAEAREGNSIQLRLTSTNKMKPTFKGKLTGFKNSDGEVLEEKPVTIPVEWFNPTAIRKMFA